MSPSRRGPTGDFSALSRSCTRRRGPFALGDPPPPPPSSADSVADAPPLRGNEGSAANGPTIKEGILGGVFTVSSVTSIRQDDVDQDYPCPRPCGNGRRRGAERRRADGRQREEREARNCGSRLWRTQRIRRCFGTRNFQLLFRSWSPELLIRRRAVRLSVKLLLGTRDIHCRHQRSRRTGSAARCRARRQTSSVLGQGPIRGASRPSLPGPCAQALSR